MISIKLFKIVLVHFVIIFNFGLGYSQNQNIELRNVNFYEDGKYRLIDRIYVTKGVFSEVKPQHIDTVINLSSKYVIPALAEGHAHTLDDLENIDEIIANYRNQGVYYVWILNNYSSKASQIREKLVENNFTNVLLANGGITHTGNHPIFLFEGLNSGIKQHWLPENKAKIGQRRTANNDAYWLFDTLEMFDEKWNDYLKTRPDVVKVYINDISNKLTQGKKTLGIPVLKKIVEKAEEENLRVVAHIETFDDLKTGIDAGIRIYGHLPYYTINFVDQLPSQPTFSEKQIQRIKELKPVIIPTLLFNQEFSTKYEASNGYKPVIDTISFNRGLSFQKETIETLKTAGFNFAIGSDKESLLPEIKYWFENGIFEKNEILKIITYDTSKLMYPNRKINRIEEGHEANFIVLHSNPIDNWQNLKDINFRVFGGKLEY